MCLTSWMMSVCCVALYSLVVLSGCTPRLYPLFVRARAYEWRVFSTALLPCRPAIRCMPLT